MAAIAAYAKLWDVSTHNFIQYIANMWFPGPGGNIKNFDFQNTMDKGSTFFRPF